MSSFLNFYFEYDEIKEGRTNFTGWPPAPRLSSNIFSSAITICRQFWRRWRSQFLHGASIEVFTKRHRRHDRRKRKIQPRCVATRSVDTVHEPFWIFPSSGAFVHTLFMSIGNHPYSHTVIDYDTRTGVVCTAWSPRSLCLSLSHSPFGHSFAFGVGVAPVSIQRCIFRHRKLCSFVDMECWSAVRALEHGVDMGDVCIGVHMLVPNTCPMR